MKGYAVTFCRGRKGCPNAAVDDAADLEARVAAVVERHHAARFAPEERDGVLPNHRTVKIAVSCCPNGCSQPQIADVGFLGARRPMLTSQPCADCAQCAKRCQERAIVMRTDAVGPVLDFEKCVACGQCIDVCPTGTLGEGARGWRIQFGGKLGRHPRLAEEVGGIHSAAECAAFLDCALAFHAERATRGERLSTLLDRAEAAAAFRVRCVEGED
ncbi:MAG: 4Fe-4S binding protein [Desulfovibrionaceae bacterium]